jgi:hypothetical protein
MYSKFSIRLLHITHNYEDGAASFVPKEEMSNLTTFLTDIYEAKEAGKVFGGAGLTGWRIIVNANSGLTGKRNTALR